MQLRSGGYEAIARLRAGLRDFWGALTISEVSGAFGDLGTFLPLLVGLVRVLGLDLGTTLIFTGLYNIASGALFGIPMPVQPMKAIAAIALADRCMRLPHVLAAGAFVSAVIFLLGITGLIGLFNRMIPDAVIRGLQLAVGLGLAEKGVRNVWSKVAEEKDLRLVPNEGAEKDITVYLGLAAAAFLLLTLYPSKEPHDASMHPSGAERAGAAASGMGEAVRKGSGGLPARGSSPTLLLHSEGAMESAPMASAGSGRLRSNRESSASLNHWLGVERAPEPRRDDKHVIQDVARKMPGALLVVLVGVVVAVVQYPVVVGALRLGPSIPRIWMPTLEEWKTGIIKAGMPQLPLTALNSVLAVCQLSADLFPARPAKPSAVSASVGAMNLAGVWFGALPCCHGSGGLAAQVRFGARSGAAPILLGVIKVLLGLLFGSSLFQLLKAFPQPLLGSLLIFAGVELAASCQKVNGERGSVLMLITAAVGITLNNIAYGFLAGLACAAVLAAWVGLPSIATAGEWLRANMTTSSTHVSTPDSTEHGAYYYEPLPNEDTAPTLPADYWGPPRVPAQPAVSTRSHPANL